MRKGDKSEKLFTAHNEPVFAIDWHPEDKNWLATAGRDKMIKVRHPAAAGGLATGHDKLISMKLSLVISWPHIIVMVRLSLVSSWPS